MRSNTTRIEAESVARKNSPPVRAAIVLSRPSSMSTCVCITRVTTAPVNESRTFTGTGTIPPLPTPTV